jgi:uncharacterized protein
MWHAFMIPSRLKAAAQRTYNRFVRLKGAPREIALGFSLGLMIGMTPFMGLHFVSSVLLASLLGWSKISAIVGVNITNVVTAPFIYPLNYWVGAKLVGISDGVQWPRGLRFSEMLTLIKHSPQILADLIFGGLILGIPLSVFGYFIAFWAVRVYRKRHPLSASDQYSR